MRARRAVGATWPLVTDVNRAAATVVNVLWWAGTIFGLVGGALIVGEYVTGLVT